VPDGAIVNKGLTLRAAQTHVPRWSDELLGRLADGRIDPSFVVTHRARLEDGPALYELSRTRSDGCIKAVMQPGG